MGIRRWLKNTALSLLSCVLLVLTSFNVSSVAAEEVFWGDYDGDGRRDRAAYNGAGFWTISTNTGVLTVQWGKSGDIPLPADYDCDGVTEIAVWRPSDGNWFISLENRSWSAGVGRKTIQWGSKGDVPVPADYDRDCKTEVAVWRPSDGICFISLENQSWDKDIGRYSDQSRLCGRS